MKLLFLALALAACSSSGPSASISGTIRGQTYSPKDAISAVGNIQEQGYTVQVGGIMLANPTGVCALVGSGKEPKNMQALLLALAEISGSSYVAPILPGDFTIYAGSASGSLPPRLAMAFAFTTDASCQMEDAHVASGLSGTVHLSKVNTDGTYEGTFDMQMAQTDSNGNPTTTPEHVTGSFKTSSCPAISNVIASGGTQNLSCQ